MAAPERGINIDWRAVDPGSPAAELEVVRSFSPPFTPHSPPAARALADSYDTGGAVEFADHSDKKLQDFIKQWEGSRAQVIFGRMPDSGKKMRLRVEAAKRELERRRVDQSKDDTVWRRAVKAKSPDPDDYILDSTASKCGKNSSYTSSAKAYTQVKAAAYKEQSSLSHGKCASEKKDGLMEKDLTNRGFKTSAHRPKSTDREHLNADIDRKKKSTLRSCTRNPQKSNAVDSKGVRSKFLDQDATFDRRWNRPKNKASASFKEDVVLLDDDDDEGTEPARSADVKISNRRDESKIYYPSRTDPEAVELTYSDMKCLQPEEYLKSPVINFFLQYLKNSRSRRDLYMFNTYFYSKLEEALSALGDRDTQFSKLRRWWRSVDIFKKAYIILPINETIHWSLIVVCMPAKGKDSGPIILHLDSLGLHNSQKLFDTVVRYLEAEWRYLQKDSSYDIPFSEKIWKRLLRNIKREKVEVPRQRNEYDCGLFMLYYIDKFIQEAPERLTKENLGMFGRKWFNHEEASQLRQGIQACLFDLFQSAQEDDGPSEASELEWHPGLHSEGEDKDADTVMAITLESSDK
ncbi:unnamed protein product [Urochloa decumbens]|uniref:Ubiquitin-like protease family profile domain-containing protein n=1 Tax=Urochloa decumbens TaxID=240449 RepID=A0ABC8YPE4_9POAL